MEASKKKQRAGGVDKVSIDDVKAYGEDRLLWKIAEELTKRNIDASLSDEPIFQNQMVGKRALGIPTIKDRIVQMAAKIVIEPVFEAGFSTLFIWIPTKTKC